MALIMSGVSECSLCGNILEEEHEIIGWMAFLTQEHPLWQYSDSGMHKACFDAWEHAPFFEHLCNYQPCFTTSPGLLDFVEEHGIPKWVLEILEFRRNNPLPVDWKTRGS